MPKLLFNFFVSFANLLVSLVSMGGDTARAHGRVVSPPDEDVVGHTSASVVGCLGRAVPTSISPVPWVGGL
jgi:hypothetical protein